jgi:hypothetical protein
MKKSVQSRMGAGRATVGPRSGVRVTEPELYPQLFMLVAGRALPVHTKGSPTASLWSRLDGLTCYRTPHQVGELSR